MKAYPSVQKSILWSFVLLITCLMASVAHATDPKDLAVAEKVLPLLQDKLSGNVNVAIVYDPANPASKSDADAIKAAIEASPTVSGMTLTPTMVTISDLGKLAQSKMAILAYGLKSSFDAIAAAAVPGGTLTISTDLDCVKSNKCVLGVVSAPSVDIYYSKTAADAGKVGFAPAFTMLVKQI